jgi:hypothetical protein
MKKLIHRYRDFVQAGGDPLTVDTHIEGPRGREHKVFPGDQHADANKALEDKGYAVERRKGNTVLYRHPETGHSAISTILGGVAQVTHLDGDGNPTLATGSGRTQRKIP